MSSDSTRLVVGNYAGSTNGVGLYFQGVVPSGNNYVASAVSANITATIDNPSSVTNSQGTVTPGRTPGTGAVSSTGAATYHIPLWVPAGPRGIQPNLSLDYNSQSGEGLLGPGWALSGLGAISRCNRTVAQDTTPGAVTLTMADVYCLNGNRLRLTSGTYGAAGSTYQTEFADFSLTTAYGTVNNNGPQYFFVQTRDGLTYEYGNTTDSRISASGASTPYQWLLNKVRDRYGNNYVVVYGNGQTGSAGIGVPVMISFTPSTSGSSTYNYTVNFTYGPRAANDQVIAYVDGFNVTNANLLTGVSVMYGSSSAKYYQLAYGASPTTARALLTSVQECTDSTLSNCLSPTSVTYQTGQVGTVSTATTASGVNCPGTATALNAADFNGDGRKDIVCTSSVSGVQHNYVSLAQSAGGFASFIDLGAVSSGNFNIWDDFAGAGRKDFLQSTGGTFFWVHWNGSSFVSTSTNTPVNPSGLGAASYYISADINGDGLPDLVWQVGQTIYTRLNTTQGGTVSFASTYTVGYTIPDSNPVLINSRQISPRLTRVDFDGDGREDVAYNYAVATVINYQQVQVNYFTVELLSQGTTFNRGAWIPGNATPGNWNNDSCTDMYVNDQINNGGVEVLISQCNGTGSTISVSEPVSSWYPLVVDWDADGRDDMLQSQNGYLTAYLSAGGGTLGAMINTGIPVGTGLWSALDMDGDGLDDLVYLDPTNGNAISYYLHNAAGTPPDLLSGVFDGYGNALMPTYVSLAQGSYTEYSDAAYPDENYIGPLYVVSKATYSDPSNAPIGTYSQTYTYSGAWTNLQGRGFDGFALTSMLDSRNSLSYLTDYKRAFPYTGMAYQTDVVNGSTNVSETIGTPAVTTWNLGTNSQRSFPYLSGTTTTQRELGGAENGQLITTTATTYGYDNYGNQTSVATTVTDNDPGSPLNGKTWTTTTTNTFDVDGADQSADLAAWCLTMPAPQSQANASVVAYTSTATGATAVTRTKAFTLDTPANCRILSTITEPASGSYMVTEALGYDAFGNVNSESVSGINMSPARVTSTYWGTTGQFPTTITDPSSAVTQVSYNLLYGLPATLTDPNSTTSNPIITSWQYSDGFGRLTKEIRPDQTSTSVSYSLYSGFDPKPRLITTAQKLDSASNVITTTTSYADMLDRPLYQLSTLLDGTTAWTKYQTYNAMGNVATSFFPYPSSGSNVGNWAYSYDALNRPIGAQRPAFAGSGSNATYGYQYAGRTTSVTDPNNVVTKQITDVNGLLRQTIDANNYTVTITYDAAGSKNGVTDSLSHTLLSNVSYGQGIGPFLLTAKDADLGTWSYTFDALGELTSWKDPNHSAFVFGETYDVLSRPTTRSEPDLFAQWTWGSSAASDNIGKLQSVCTGTGTNPTNCTSAPGYSEAESYDVIGRPSTRAITIPGSGTFTYTWNYGANGQVSTLTYPVSTSGYALKVQYGYAYGLLQSVTNISDTPNVPLWTASAVNAGGQITQEAVANGTVVTSRTYDAVTRWLSSVSAGVGGGTGLENLGFQYDPLGNVLQRQNNTLGLTENFYYDNDYRLTSSKLNGVQNLSISYDVSGNITSRSDIASGAIWTYDPNRYHAVTQAGNSSYTYGYDLNGNAISRNGSTINWSSYNYPTSITAVDATGTEQVQFSYGPDRSRWQQSYLLNGVQTETTNYIGGLLEQVISGGVTDYRHYVYAGNEPVAVYSRKSTATNTWSYFLSDHQGSIAGIINSSGAIDVNESFSAYGARRNPATWSGAPAIQDLSSIAGLSRQGYTFQTALGQSMGLNHMNGRVQDAITGRFLSADPNIPDPSATQDYNRFSYVNNNPATYVDPSGFAVVPPMVTQSCINGYLANPCQPTTSDSLDEVVVSAPRFFPLFDDSAWMCPEGACLADFLWPYLSYQLTNSSGSQLTANGKATSTTPNDPKAKTEGSCPMSTPTSAMQTAADQVRYTDTSGNWMVLSNGSRDWATNNPNAVTRGFGLSIGSYTGAGVTSPIFPNYQAGYQAAILQWSSPKYQNAPSILAALNTYTGAQLTATSWYVTTVMAQVPNATPSTSINQLTTSQMTGLLAGQQQAEIWTPGSMTCGAGAPSSAGVSR